jgi:hypothetical protein
LAAQLGGARVRLEAFAARERRRHRPERGGAARADLDPAGALL